MATETNDTDASFVQPGLHLYQTDFTALNNSGVSGQASVLINTDSQTVMVDIQAKGLEPDQVHPQHIHGFTDGTDAQSPTIAQDADHDGFVELGEGLVKYGPVQLNLTLNPEDSEHDHGTAGHDHTANAVFPTAAADGTLHYHETFHFDPADPNAQAIFDSITPLDLKEVVLHGESVAAGSGAGTEGEVDGTAGYKAVLPVASGELHEVTDAAAVQAALDHFDFPSGGGEEVVDWNAIAAQVTANFEATGQWFL